MKSSAAFLIAFLIAPLLPHTGYASSDDDLRRFQQYCIPLVSGENSTALDGLHKVSDEATALFIKKFQAPQTTVLWETGSGAFLLQTYAGDTNYCHMFGFQIDYADLKSAIDKVLSGLGDTYRTNGTFALDPKQRRAGIFLARDLGDRGVLQLTFHYHEQPRRLATFTAIRLDSFTAIRLDSFSPAALELFPEKADK